MTANSVDYALGVAHDNRTASMFCFVSADTFAAFYFVARESSDHIRRATSVYDYVEDESGIDFRLSLDGKSGYAIRDGELIYVFSTVRGRGNDLVADAIRCGATHLNCFDGYLTTFYSTHGFLVYNREPNWTPGGPDVVHMRRHISPDEPVDVTLDHARRIYNRHHDG